MDLIHQQTNRSTWWGKINGTVAEINATVGAQVQVEALLVRIEAPTNEGE